MCYQRKLLFLVNGHAGKGAIRGHMLAILDTFARAGYVPTVYITQRAGEIPGIAAREAGKYDLVVCSGGDGTLNETVNGLMTLALPPMLGYIPAGTTNDFANSLCIPKNMEKAADTAVNGFPMKVDVGRFGDQYFAYVAAFGAFTDVPYATSQETKNILGKLAYLVEGASRLTSIRAYQLKLEYDGGQVEGEFLVGLISNSSYVASLPVGKLVDASMNDGLLEVNLVRRPPMMIQLTRLVSSLLMGELDSELVFSVKTSRLRVISAQSIPWTLDGEYGGEHAEIELENLPQAISVHVPLEGLSAGGQLE